MDTIVVFTGKSQDRIVREGGTSSWRLDPRRAADCTYTVCTRSGVSWVEGKERQGSAFLVGRISNVVDADDDAGRYLVRFSEFAEVSIPDVWKGWRNPIKYTTLKELGIDPDKLKFQAMPITAEEDVLTTDQTRAAFGQKMIEIKLRFWTNGIAEGDDNIRPNHAWDSGVVRIERNKSHGITPGAPIPFHSMLDVGRAIEKCLIDHGTTLHPSRRTQKYVSITK